MFFIYTHPTRTCPSAKHTIFTFIHNIPSFARNRRFIDKRAKTRDFSHEIQRAKHARRLCASCVFYATNTSPVFFVRIRTFTAGKFRFSWS